MSHPITHLRRYAAAANSITLDFADYEQEYMTFKTKQGEEILNLISGYIDIYLKRKRCTRISTCLFYFYFSFVYAYILLQRLGQFRKKMTLRRRRSRSSRQFAAWPRRVFS